MAMGVEVLRGWQNWWSVANVVNGERLAVKPEDSIHEREVRADTYPKVNRGRRCVRRFYSGTL